MRRSERNICWSKENRLQGSSVRIQDRMPSDTEIIGFIRREFINFEWTQPDFAILFVPEDRLDKSRTLHPELMNT